MRRPFTLQEDSSRGPDEKTWKRIPLLFRYARILLGYAGRIQKPFGRFSYLRFVLVRVKRYRARILRRIKRNSEGHPVFLLIIRPRNVFLRRDPSSRNSSSRLGLMESLPQGNMTVETVQRW